MLGASAATSQLGHGGQCHGQVGQIAPNYLESLDIRERVSLLMLMSITTGSSREMEAGCNEDTVENIPV